MSALRKEIGYHEIMARLDSLQRAIKELSLDARPEWYTVRQVADHRGKSVRTIQRKISAGEIPVTPRHGERMIHRDDI